MHPGLAPVVQQHLTGRQVQVQREQVVFVAVVNVPLLPGHVPPVLTVVDVQPVGCDET